MAATQATVTIWARMAKVMAAVDRIAKNGKNDKQNYNYATEADIADEVRKALAENGIAFFPSVVEWDRNEVTTGSGGRAYLTRVHLVVRWVDTESGESAESHWWGEGHDTLDKSYYKAYSGAIKYALLKTFLISTGDDPEADQGGGSNRQQRPQGQQSRQQGQQQNQQRQAPPPPAPKQEGQQQQSPAMQPTQQQAAADSQHGDESEPMGDRTNSQANTIKNICQRLGVDPEVMAQKWSGHSLHGISKGQASSLIERLGQLTADQAQAIANGTAASGGAAR